MTERSKLEIIEHCGHMATMEQPQAVSAALISWLDGASAARAG
jgi:pimeloyl-ACP methyl ester carboxylesterase